MNPHATSVLLVPPLSAYGGVPSMTLYWQNLSETLNGINGHRPGMSFRVVSPPAQWRVAGVRRRICQRIVLPALVRQEFGKERRAGRYPMLHVLDPYYAHLLPSNGRGSITCHDLDGLVSPRTGLAKAEERWRLRQLVRAGAIHAISGNTARDIERFFPGKTANIIVNYYGLSPDFHQRRPLPNAPHLESLRVAPKSIFVLHVGSNIERKNIATLLHGFALAKRLLPGHRLKLIKVGDSLRSDGFGPRLDELQIGGDLIHLGPLKVPELVDVYNACTIFAFPSRYEGFGRPVLEAQACGLPCVLADSSSLPEVGGDAALYHPTHDAPRMAGHLVDLVNKDDLRRQLIARGIANAARFTWQRHVDTIAERLRQLRDFVTVPE